MASENETIEDIVRYMRNESHAGDASCLEWVGAKIRGYADRIEAAAMEKCVNIKNVPYCYSDKIILSVSNRNLISHYAFKTIKDAKEVLNILSDYTGIPVTTTDDITYRVGKRIELIKYPF